MRGSGGPPPTIHTSHLPFLPTLLGVGCGRSRFVAYLEGRPAVSKEKDQGRLMPRKGIFIVTATMGPLGRFQTIRQARGVQKIKKICRGIKKRRSEDRKGPRPLCHKGLARGDLGAPFNVSVGVRSDMAQLTQARNIDGRGGRAKTGVGELRGGEEMRR